MVRRVARTGAPVDPVWYSAFNAVPRHLFVPVYYRLLPQTGGGASGTGAGRRAGTDGAGGAGGVRGPATGGPAGFETLAADDPDPGRRARWLSGAYEDVPLVTRIRARGPVSSSSQPSLMAAMLDALDVRDGDAVLEIGAGTGYNAGLLAHRLGDGLVTTVDLDEDIANAARRHLEAAGYRPEVVTGDGALGWGPGAPYDRVMATCAMPWIPVPWLRQCRPGAVVLAPMAGGLVRLTVSGAERAEGRFLAPPAYFVSLRGAGTADRGAVREPAYPGRRAGDVRRRRTGTGARAIRNEALRFLVGLVAGELDVRWTFDGKRRLRGVVLGARDGSAVSVGHDGTVLTTGPRDLWALVESAYGLWQDEGRPTRGRFGVTVEDGRQWCWLDDPTGEFHWPLCGVS